MIGQFTEASEFICNLIKHIKNAVLKNMKVLLVSWSSHI